MKRIISAMVVGAAFTACSQTAEMKPQHDTQPAAQIAQQMPEMSQEEMMQKITEAATPGKEHMQLAPLVGTWRTEARFWNEPSQPPEVSTGIAEHTWIYGKRFVKENYRGKWNGQPFEGMGLIGFDNVRKEYVSTWTDSMGTGILTAEGNYDPAKRELEMISTFSCPLTGGIRKNRSVTRIISNNEHVFEMWDQLPNGKERKMMEIKYERKS